MTGEELAAGERWEAERGLNVSDEIAAWRREVDAKLAAGRSIESALTSTRLPACASCGAASAPYGQQVHDPECWVAITDLELGIRSSHDLDHGADHEIDARALDSIAASLQRLDQYRSTAEPDPDGLGRWLLVTLLEVVDAVARTGREVDSP